ncbi:cell division protein FtsB [Peptoniphilus koenoeneniae]|uniref:Cell division protein FtsB n=1 Tax=Peptoniphilus koenoeneniae TaxID=507751 RepID=A0ABU0ARZ7_9FIRM|nr:MULTISPECIES: cell division protein FtsL [Peptoniphilus]ERT62238.1 cell division protein FtsL [Peptoniphilus sp. BV3C26]MDQ0274036.1 cell division protein FtsB [Peptoniphilus koenoeneniae]
MKGKLKRQKSLIRKRKIKMSNMPLVLTCILVIILSIVVTALQAQISNLDRALIKQESEIKDLENTKLSLEGEIKGIISSQEIQDAAMYKLGMVHPDEKQIVYIDVKEDKKQKDVNNNVFLSPIVSVIKSFTKN